MVNREIILLLDLSFKSGTKKINSTQTGLDVIKKSIGILLKKLAQPGVKISLVAFGDKAVRITEGFWIDIFTDIDAVTAGIERCNLVGGYANTGDALRMAYGMLKGREPGTEGFIGILTTGNTAMFTTENKQSKGEFKWLGENIYKTTGTDTAAYIYCDEKRALSYAVQMGDLIRDNNIRVFTLLFSKFSNSQIEQIAEHCFSFERKNGNYNKKRFDGRERGKRYYYLLNSQDMGEISSMLWDSILDREAPSAPNSLTLITVTDTRAILQWSPSTDNINVVGYDIYCDDKLVGSTSETGFIISSLKAGTTYKATVRAKDSVGNVSQDSKPLLIKTNTVPPLPPTGLVNIGKTDTTVSLSWLAPVSGCEVACYNIYIGTTKRTSTLGTVRNCTISALQPNQVYDFSIKAVNAYGDESGASNTVRVKTLALPIVLVLTCQSRTTHSTDLSWTVSGNSEGVAEYVIYCEGIILESAGFSTNHTVLGLKPDTEYSFVVKAIDGTGSVLAASSEVKVRTLVDIQAPTRPANLKATQITGNSVTLSWSKASDDIGVTGYEVFKGSELAGSTSNETLTVGTLAPGTYSFTVKAVDAAGNISEPSEALQLTIGAAESVRLLYRIDNTNNPKTVAPYIRLENDGTATLKLSDIKIRYWYTMEAGMGEQIFETYYYSSQAEPKGRFVQLSPVRNKANCYLEIYYLNTEETLPTGMLLEIVAFHEGNWLEYNQTDDYSYDAAAMGQQFRENRNITVYIKDILKWGVEPEVLY